VRVRPWFVPLAAAALLAMWVLGSRYGASHAGAGVAALAAHDTVYVRFEFAAPAARAVNVAGDFNGWKPDATLMSRGSGGVWVATIPIVVGVHKYQFVVDGSTWVPDPAAGTTDDGFGGRNSLIVVGPKGVVRS
jgi:1,4-alpha-glucan branching enzyme